MAINKSRLAEIYKSEKSKGGGLTTTLGKRALEKFDPRQMFNQSGFAAAVLPSLFKSYSAIKKPDKLMSQAPQATSPVLENKIDLLINETRDVKINSKLSAKNSMALPEMARDMNVMRQNMQKLVKLQGGTPARGADMYFKKAGEREASYESQFGKEKSKISPTLVGEKKEEKKEGGILGLIATLLAPILAIGGKIVSAITSSLAGIGEFVLKGLLNVFTIDNVMKTLGIAKDALGAIFRIATMVATNPIFLAVAGIASIAAMLSYLRGNYDDDKARYMELAKKKREQGRLSDDEQKELEKLNRPTLQAEARKQLDGYDPITGKIEKGTSPQSVVTTNRMNDAQLRMTATEQLMEEFEAGGNKDKSLDPSNNENVNRRFVELKKQATTGKGGVPSTSAEGMKNYAPRDTFAKEQENAKQADLMKSYTTRAPTPVSSVLLDAIAKGESAGSGDYDAMNQGTPGNGSVIGSGNSQNVIGEKLTDMTIGEIMQRAAKPNDDAKTRKEKGLIFAAGRYQIIPKTLEGLVKSGVADPSEKFTPEVQDRLGMELINRTGATKLASEGRFDEAQNALAKTWASIPLATDVGDKKAGQSYYQKVGQNVAHAGAGKDIFAGLKSGAAMGSSGPAVTMASLDVGKMRDQRMQSSPVVNNVTNNNVNNTTTAGGQSQGNLPSVYDDVFLNLFQRVS
jgi:hypothetical protein